MKNLITVITKNKIKMKKIIFLLIVTMFSFSASAQDSTVVAVTDSSNAYNYANVYVVVDYINMMPKGTRYGIGVISQSVPARTQFETYMHVSVYSSKVDYLAGKSLLFQKALVPLLTTNFPTIAQLRTHFKNNIQ